MTRLGYPRYVAQGGDWGAVVTTLMGANPPAELAAIHLNMPLVVPPPPYENLSPAEQAALAAYARYDSEESGYAKEQMTRPQTIGYALTDSAVGQAAWIYEKFWAWTDCDGDPRSVFGFDELLDNIMIYWLSRSGASSARLYWESMRSFRTTRVEIPVGCSTFPKELARAPRSWAERVYPKLVHWNELPRGGHFAAFERPGDFVAELRAFASRLRESRFHA
jgi:pimeloyl-ACP methyl ester carboxylesterase